MTASFILSLREGLEAALIIGIILGVLRKIGHQKLNKSVWLGVFSAIFISFLVAIVLNWFGAEFDGEGEQLFEGVTMFLAAGVLTWMVLWMRNQTKSMKQKIETRINQAEQGQGQQALFFLAFLAVVREGIELALFLLAVRLTSNPFQEFMGAALGLSLAALLGWIIFATSRTLSLSKFFQSTNILLALFAAGLVGLGTREFNELGWIPPLIEHVWNLNTLIPDESILGQLLKAMIGYDSSPSLSQVIAYWGYFVLLGMVLWINRQSSRSMESFNK